MIATRAEQLDVAPPLSTVLANLAVALARTGKRVIVVCCDLRRPSIHEFFGLANTVGFTSVLLNEVTLAGALQVVEAEPNIVVLASGPPAPNPSELLASPAAGSIFGHLKLRPVSDVVLIDCPPLLPVTDSTIISSYVDATLLMVAAGETTQPRMSQAVNLLRQVDAPLVGVVLNGVDLENGYAGTYSYAQVDPSVRRRLSIGFRRPSPEAARSARRRGGG